MSMYTPLLEDEELEKLEADLDMCDRVFVYGTLKKGYCNNVLLGASTLLTNTTTEEPFVLGDIGFPYAFNKSIVPEKYAQLLFPVKGEVFKIDSLVTFINLDGLEGYPRHYNRRIIRTLSGLTAWMYMQDDWSVAESCDACNLKEGVWIWSGR